MAHIFGHRIDDEQDDPTHEQGDADDDGRLVEHLLDEIARQNAHDHSRKAGKDHRDGKMPSIGLAGQSIADENG